MMFKLRLGDSIQMTTTVFGLPRTGNQEFADLVDQMVRIIAALDIHTAN